jgi:diguanylate cyclase (GGDEF)-like protein
MEELRRYGWDFGVIFIDIDHFKEVNDTYGHAVGDGVLRMVAHALKNSLRSFDFVGRWGGEEFIIILPNITSDVLAMVAERCRAKVQECTFQTEGRELSVTISAGAVLAEPGEEVDQVVKRADVLMYRSKHGGRNRVTVEEE